MKGAICEITWQHEGHFHVFLRLAGKKPFPWSHLYTAGPCDLFVLLISRAAKLCFNLQGLGFSRKCISGKRHMNCQIHANCFWNTCSVNERRQPLRIKLPLWQHECGITSFLYNCVAQSVGHRNSGSVCKTKVLEVLVCCILGFKLRKVKNRCPYVEQWAKFRRMKSARRVSVSGQRL